MVRATPPTFVPPEEALQEIDSLLEELAKLTRSDKSPQAFHGELLDRAVRALTGVAGAFWVRDADGGWESDVRSDQTGLELIERLRTSAAHGDLLSDVSREATARHILPGAGAGDRLAINPTEFLLLLCPVVAEATPVGVLEIAQHPGAAPAVQQGYLRLLSAVCELAAEFHQRRLVRTWQDRAGRSVRIEQFVERVHASLNLDETAAAIANEGRRLTGCDRLSVAIIRPGSCRIVAISGQEEIDRRANVVRLLESLTSAVVATGEPFWYGSEQQSLPPQISVPLGAYLDEAHPHVLAILPLRQKVPPEHGESLPAPFGALIVERFEGGAADEAFRERIGFVERQGGLAFCNALQHEGLPFYPVLRGLAQWRWLAKTRQLPRTLLALAGSIGVVLVFTFIPADFEITGRGALQPELRREVFAGSDGIVAEVRADQGQACQAGEVLVVLTRSQLDFEFSRVLGETQTARKRLAGVTAARLESTPRTAAEREKYNELAAEEEELKALLANLAEQEGVLRVQQEELRIKSPIDGQVITWNVRELLEARPVQRGQALLTVADLGGPWVLEIEVPDDRIGHVLEARQSLRPDLDVTFMLATAPGTTYRGAIERVSLATDARVNELPHVLVTVRFDRDTVPQLRPGATVVPRIHCGRRSLGYVWFHGLIETVQKFVLF
jgi:multidrug efflux pump subunit AcrA (membrane-fusion protein)